MSEIEVADALTVVFTTVLDRTVLGIEEEEEADEPRDRAYWERKASKATLAIVDRLLDLTRQVEPGIALKYNKNYVGLSRAGVASNFLTFRPKKWHVIFEGKIPGSEELTQRLVDAGSNCSPPAPAGAGERAAGCATSYRLVRQRRVLRVDLLGCHPDRKAIEYDVDRDARASEAGLPVDDRRVGVDEVEKLIGHAPIIPRGQC